jgi:cbb3-type cytochrome oxidase subunit 3
MTILNWLLEHSVAFVGTIYLLLIASVLWPGRRERFQRDAMIPFQDDTQEPAHVKQ